MDTARREFRKNINTKFDFVFENYVQIYLKLHKGYKVLFDCITKE